MRQEISRIWISAVPSKRGLLPILGLPFLIPPFRASGRGHREDRLERGIRLDDAALVQALRSRIRPIWQTYFPT